MNLTLLVPRTSHSAIEERFGSWQSEILLKADHPEAVLHHYEPSWTGEKILEDVETDWVLALTDPTALATNQIGASLLSLLVDESIDAAIPVTNESTNDHQRQAPLEPYLTLRQLELVAGAMKGRPGQPAMIEWDGSNPGLFAAPAEILDFPFTLDRILKGRRVAVVPHAFLHRYTSHRGQGRADLLERIPFEARAILEFGCGEGAFGAALKERQRCSITGIELDPVAASLAARRLDTVLTGDARDVIYKLKQRFDWIVGGDILEHIDDPWAFLGDLRHVAEPGGHLLLSLPNIANWAVIDDLLHGRFDYTYLGILCAGHLRHFTRESIQQMLTISGWELISIEPQEKVLTKRYHQLADRLDACGVELQREDLEAPGWYVIARNKQ